MKAGRRRPARLTPVGVGERLRLADRDARPPTRLGNNEQLERELAHQLERAADLQVALWAEGARAVLVVLQGRDASGKDGTVRHVIGAFNPQACAITSFKRPSELEFRHDYLWRVHAVVPAKGMIGVFNRSHYEDVLVPRVHAAITAKECRRRYREINQFERMLAANGVTILKFFLHLSRAEQARRLADRLDDPMKNWKYEAQDLVERARWPGYTRAYRELLARCSTKWAPWYVVPADDKLVRNVLIARTIADTLAEMAPKFPRVDRKVLAAARGLRRR